MLRFLLLRPVAVLMSALGLIALGAVSLRTLPVSLLPDVPIPEISVQISYPNTSARELENTVTTPLRNQLLQVGKLRDLRSQSRNGSATIVLEFDFGTNTDLAFIEVNEKIDQAMDYLPRDLERPRVIKANVSDIPVFYLSVTPRPTDSLRAAQSLLDLSEFSRVILKRRMEQLPQVAFVDVSGYAEPEVRITPDAATLQSLGLSERDLETLLQQNNLSLGSIALQDNQYQYNVRFLSTLSSVDDIRQIRFNHQGRILQLREVADVQLSQRPRRGLYLRQGREGIVFSVYKQADAQLFDLKAGFEDLLRALRKDYPGLQFELSNDQSEILDISIQNLLTSLGYGALFAFLVLVVFFREWRTPLLIGVTVPVSLVMSFLGFYLLGISINVISLAGLILGVGLLVDNSIIVIENIRQQRRMGLPLTEACAEGGNEVIRPLISSALTTCSVFLPLVFLSGIAGALFYDQAVSISIVLATSLLASYVLIPTLVRLIEQRRTLKPEQFSPDSWYYRSVHVVLQMPWLSILFFLLLIGGGYWLLLQLPQESFPRLSRNALEVRIDWAEPVSVAENERRVQRLLAAPDVPVITSDAFIGEQQFLLSNEIQTGNEAMVILYSTDANTNALSQAVNEHIARHYPEAEVRTAPLRNVFDAIFGGERPALVAHVQAVQNQRTPDRAAVAPLLNQWTQAGIAWKILPLQETYTIAIQKEPALRYDVPYDNIYARLQTLLGQRASGTMRSVGAYVPVVLSGAPRGFETMLASETVLNRRNEPLPLRYFIQVERTRDAKVLTAGKAGEALNLILPEGNLRTMQQIRQQARAYPELSINFSGQLFENQRIVREVSLVALVSLGLLYFILAAQFESLLQPLIVMLTVPVGATGAAGLLLLSGQSLNLISLIGLVVMGGIAVNDAILKVDMMNRLSKAHPLEEAIHIAGYRRLRAIVMTSLTTILALTPVLFSAGLGAELQQPLAFSVIGGLVFTTLASLYFVPALYKILYRKKGDDGR